MATNATFSTQNFALFQALSWSMIIEMLLHIPTILFVILNCVVIFKTAVVHQNLKFILLVQSFLIGIYSVSRLFGWMLILVPYKFDRNWTMLLAKSGTFLGIFSAQYVNFLGHVLLVERIIATVLAHCYEQFRTPIINGVWFIVLTAICVVNSLLSGIFNTGLTLAIAVNLIALILSLVEIFALIQIGIYNKNKFAQTKFFTKRLRNDLSQRYQLHENIEMIQKLGPTFVFHFMLTLTYCVKLICLQMLPSFAFLIIQLAVVFFNLGIVISVALFHPALNKMFVHFKDRVKKLLSARIRGKNRVVPAGLAGATLAPALSADEQKAAQVMQLYFEELRKSWSSNN